MSEFTFLSCEETFQRLGDFIDRELSAEEMQLVKAHLDVCRECAVEFKFEESVIRQVKDKVQHLAVPDDLMERVSKALDSAD